MTALLILQILVSIGLVAAILMQSPAGGLGATFGGGGNFHTKRGMERTLFAATIILAVIFTGIAIISLMIA